MRLSLSLAVLGVVLALAPACGPGQQQLATVGVYSVVEIAFEGPRQGPADTPVREIEFAVRFRHESGSPEYRIRGFWDGDGKGGSDGNIFKIRFCPTKTGRWDLVEVRSTNSRLSRQHLGDYVTATPSDKPGFWLPDSESAAQHWYRRSDGSHPYIIGNTHYSFLSGYKDDGQPSGNDIAADVRGNAVYFRKLRFALHGDRYPNPDVKPYFDDAGKPTDDGNYSHRPNPAWFHRADVAVQTAYDADLIADLILCGPDTTESRSTIAPTQNNGDPRPYLHYVAARYGSYPNVWLCIANEYDIKEPRYTAEQISQVGAALRAMLPYPTPLSVHASPRPLWPVEFDSLPPWNDHQILQRKLRTLAEAADTINQVWKNGDGAGPRDKPTIDDELSYQGDGDQHSEADTVEAHLGAFLGGGYGTTGWKPANKLGQYFWGNFNAAEHTAAPHLKWLREQIDAHITFWKMQPDLAIFGNLDAGFRAMSWPGEEYVLGTNKPRKELIANLPEGQWTVTRYEIFSHQATTLSEDAAGRFAFDSPDSRAVLFHFKKKE
jgi:Domain of unknown function (DUF5060)/Protein of unknown function (DUF4038)